MRKEDYIKTIKVNGYTVDIGLDDYGQCYYFEYVDKNGKLQEVGCGSYNFNYEQEIKDYFNILEKYK